MNDRIPARGRYTEEARRRRLEWLRERTGAPLDSLGSGALDPRKLAGNIENFVAGVEVPVGLAGPLEFHGEHARGPIVAPLATTEGTLVASTSRGARAITRSGGVTTKVLSQQMVRAPAWEFDGIPAAARFVAWVGAEREAISAQVGLVSRHARLVELEPFQIGRYVHLRFVYETADAAGQNMTTAATWSACRWINDALARSPGLEPLMFVVEGNMAGDKKAGYLSLIAGRGMRVTAECFVDRETVESVLKTTPEAIDRAHRLGVVGGQQAGMLGYSINVSNVVAALFVATGQDIGCVHESGAGIYAVESTGDGVLATMLLPSLVVGTVGGGTRLPQQHDLLAALGCAGDGHASRLAEIVCGFALALDLSTISAVAGGQFADAHERLGRRHRVDWLKPDDLDAALLEPMLAETLDADGLRVTEVARLDEPVGSSIISELTAFGERRKLLGLHPLRVTYSTGNGRPRSLDLVAKVKPLDQELIVETGKLASLCGAKVSEAWRRWGQWAGFAGTHTRELAIYRRPEPGLRAVLPRPYGIHEDPRREAYLIVMERLGDDVLLLDAVEEPGRWTAEDVDRALRAIAGVHAIWLGREPELLTEGWLGPVLTAERMEAMRELWLALAEHNATEHPGLIDAATHAVLERLASDAGAWWSELEALPRTLVHNDFNPRNIALRRDGRLVAYDWELATVGVPQRDLAELLAFVLSESATEAEVAHHLDVHREALAAATGAAIDLRSWRRGYELALWDFLTTRLQLYLMAHTQREYPFLERVVATAKRLWEIESERVRVDAG
ncbi:MAG: phosphotransferase [Solirubrobacterales bacterium]